MFYFRNNFNKRSVGTKTYRIDQLPNLSNRSILQYVFTINAMNFISLDDGKAGKKASKKDREKLGLDQANKGKKASKAAAAGEPKDAMQKVDVCVSWLNIHQCLYNLYANFSYKIQLEKAKQDDALDDLSDVLGDLKGMANEMGSELDKLVFSFYVYVVEITISVIFFCAHVILVNLTWPVSYHLLLVVTCYLVYT